MKGISAKQTVSYILEKEAGVTMNEAGHFHVALVVWPTMRWTPGAQWIQSRLFR